MVATYNGSNSTDGIRGQITENGTGELTAPTNIMKSASSARALYSIVRQQNLKRIGLWAAIEGLIQGNPPYDQGELDSNGLSSMANYNDLTAMSKYEKGGLLYWNLINQAEELVVFNLEYSDPVATGWAKTLAVEFTRVMREWKMFSTMVGTHSAQIVKFGLSVLLWPDERDWRPRTTELHRFLVPDQTLSDLDQMTYCFFENDYTAQYLFEVYDELQGKLSASERTDPDNYDQFWNLETLKHILLFRANSWAKANNLQPYGDFFSLQTALQNGDSGTYTNIFSDGIKLITLLYKEYDGKITHYMFDTVWSGPSFVFKADRQYNDFCDVCSIFTVSPDKFTLHSNRGVGHKIFAPCQAKNQLSCSMVDMARYSSTPMLRTPNQSTVKDPEQVKFFPGIPTNIGASEFVQNNLGNNLPQVVGVVQYMDQNLSTNLAMGGDDPSVPDASIGSTSPTQERFKSYREFGLMKNSATHFYHQMDEVYETIVAKMLHCKKGYPAYSYVEKWKKRCIAKGVPEFVFETKGEDRLPPEMTVRSTRVAGDGSTVGVIMGLQEMSPVVGKLSPKGAKAYVVDLVGAAMGPDAVPRYTQGMEDPDEISGGASLAGVENAIMMNGMSPIFSPSNEHQSHFAVHMTLNIDTMQKVTQQVASPIDAQKIFDHSIPHTEEHWKYIYSDPFSQDFVARYKRAWDDVKGYADLNRKNAIKMYQAQVRKQQEEAQATQTVMSDEQRKDFVAKREQDRKDFESTRKLVRQDTESGVRGEIQKEQAENSAQTADLKARLDSGVKTRKVEGEIGIKQAQQQIANLTEIQVPEK